jgi:hypothetical protein
MAPEATAKVLGTPRFLDRLCGQVQALLVLYLLGCSRDGQPCIVNVRSWSA